MPYVKPGKIQTGTHLKRCLEYIANPNKADYTTAINCLDDIDASINLFKTVWDFGIDTKKYKGKKANIAHHFKQSFEPGKISVKEAHDIGVELTKIIAPGYMCHVATHTDRHHIHNHIIIFAVHPETGYKYRHVWDQYKFVQEQSDAICIERGIRVIENPKKRSLSTGEYRAMERGGSWKDKLAWDIDDAIQGAAANSSGRVGFVRQLETKGYIVNYQNKNISIQLPGNKAIRVDRLAKTYGSQYTKENIERRLQGEELIPADDMNSAAAAELPLHMKYGDTERFNEYDRYLNWCMKKDKEIIIDVRKRNPPDLEIYRPRNKDQKQVFKESKDTGGVYDMGYDAEEIREKSKEEKEKGAEERKIRNFRDKLAWDIDDAIDSAVANNSGKEGFIDYLKDRGYIVKYQNKNISIQIPGRKAIRVDTLAKTYGIQYTKESIESRLIGANEDIYDIPIDTKDRKDKAEYIRAGSYRKVRFFGFTNRLSSKNGKTKDEREIERELEELGRFLSKLIRRGCRVNTMKGWWKIKEKEKERKREQIEQVKKGNER